LVPLLYHFHLLPQRLDQTARQTGVPIVVSLRVPQPQLQPIRIDVAPAVEFDVTSGPRYVHVFHFLGILSHPHRFAIRGKKQNLEEGNRS
jgi:hypothetical protein